MTSGDEAPPIGGPAAPDPGAAEGERAPFEPPAEEPGAPTSDELMNQLVGLQQRVAQRLAEEDDAAEAERRSRRGLWAALQRRRDR